MARILSRAASSYSPLPDDGPRVVRKARVRLGRVLAALLITVSLAVGAPVFGGQQPEDSRLFLAGFKAYQGKDYAGSSARLKEVLEKYPDSPLRDLALFWLSRSYYRTGNQQEAARYFSKLVKEYPDSPLKGFVEDEMYRLMTRYEQGETLPTGAGTGTNPTG